MCIVHIHSKPGGISCPVYTDRPSKGQRSTPVRRLAARRAWNGCCASTPDWCTGSSAATVGSDLPYAELLHEGQIALWQAILHYDPGRGVAFSTYAVPAIRHRLWDVVARAQRPQGYRR